MSVDNTTDDTSDDDTDDGLDLRGHPNPTGGQAIRPCPHCDDGIIWSDDDYGTTLCDSCHRSPQPARPHPTFDTLNPYSRTADRYQRGTYEQSDRTRLAGGYRHAYLSQVNGPEYAIDGYGEHTDELLVPRKRDWTLSEW